MFKKTLTSDFFTTISFPQALNSLYLLTFWLFKLRKWKEKEKFEKKLTKFLWKKDSKIISFYNWRSALFWALKIIWIEKNDEVILNSYNCVSVSNAVLQTWAKLIYTEIENETLSFDLEKLEKNISKNTKVILLQHTFWKKPKNYEKIISLAKKKKILVIEDLAHSLGNKTEILWDFAIFSTWRDKVISSITWGFLLINNKNYFKEIKNIKKKLKNPKISLVLKNLNYNIFWYFAYKFYDFFSLWKVIIFLSRKLKLITEILSVSEKSCNFIKFNLDFPNSLAYLWLKELKKIESYTKNRKEITSYYYKKLKNKKIKFVFKNIKNYNFFRVPIILESKKEKDKLYNFWKQNNILFWKSWSDINIAPIWTDLKKAKYKKWDCPLAEDISEKILTLPNHHFIWKKDRKKILEILNNF